MSVKRYDVMSYSLDVDGNSGPFVKYEDYAALEARCAALAAEVYDLKHPGTYLPSKRETPDLDAFLAEVRAQAKADGVQEYADSFRHSASIIRECNGETIHVRALLHHAKNADEFADQLRKGVQS